ncbi:uncharacterized protein Dana_GF23053 [Drosophila ananassae]|uniref:Uncharacterized protein n=1 Tax=Drosophila ananassae TaxID=7217 RepID=B3MTU8_DROAN|nr:uncharacterized protein LOC6505699 [Drosophila ananassae]EDV30229.1 uncharacterized protein Dana_GF23053 [Drosophila ananassae]
MGESTNKDPMSFLYMNLLADILMQETVEFENEFRIKMEFIRDQEKLCFSNAKNLVSVDQFLRTLNGTLLKLEMDLNENENLLIQAEDTVTILERSCVNVPEQRQCRVDPLVRATYTDLLRLLMSTEKSAVQCNSLREEIEAYNNEVSGKLMPVNVIGQIMDFHNRTLDTMEKQINLLNVQIEGLKKEFAEMAKREAKLLLAASLPHVPCIPEPKPRKPCPKNLRI